MSKLLLVAGGPLVVGVALITIGIAQIQQHHKVSAHALWHNQLTMWGIIVLVVGIGIFLVGTLGGLISGVLGLSSPFSIVHDPEDSECVENSLDANGDPYQQVRIKVVAKPSRSAREVKLKLIDREPSGRKDYMHVMNVNVGDLSRFRDRGDCEPGEPLYFDIAIHRPDHSAAIEFADSSLRNMSLLPSTTFPCSHRLSLKATGRKAEGDQKAKATTASFFLNIDSDGELSLDQEQKFRFPTATTMSALDQPASSASPGGYIAALKPLPMPSQTGPAPPGGYSQK